MMHIHPAKFYPALSEDRLQTIAVKLLDIRHSTFRELNSPFDDNYTRETAVFGRSRNMIIEMALGQMYDWLSLRHAGMDVTFCIDEVPCRFFRDDPNNPEKLGFFKRNAADDLFAVDDQQPVMWRFVVEKALTENDEDRVFLFGYNIYQEKVSEWMYRSSPPILHTVDQDVPSPANIPSASVDVREDQIINEESNLNSKDSK